MSVDFLNRNPKPTHTRRAESEDGGRGEANRTKHSSCSDATMASSDNNSNSTTSSRFKPFKFATTREKPPPPPPKDPIYQRSVANANASRTSLALLSPGSITPESPLSPSVQYAIRRANSPSPSPFSAEENMTTMNQNYSSPDLLSSSDTIGNGNSNNYNYNNNTNGNTNVNMNRQTSSGMSSASKKDKALAFLKFPKRSPRSPPLTTTTTTNATATTLSSSSNSINGVIVIGNEEADPPPPEEDDGISLPWNFQHNIHVDEGYVGLPPSWSTSLASAGFTDEEITAIQARRVAGMRPAPDLRYLYNERPRSPAVLGGFPFPATSPFPGSSQGQGQSQGVPVLTHPTPRTTSLRRMGLSTSAPSPKTEIPPPVPGPAPPVPSTRPPFNSIFPSSDINPNVNALYPSAVASASTSSLDGGLNLNSKPNPAPTSNPNRIPPPKRKPPAPVEEAEVERDRQGQDTGHRPNQLSSSTVGWSTDSHGFGTSDSQHHHHHSASQATNTTTTTSSNSHTPYGSQPLSQSKPNILSANGEEDDDDDRPLVPARRPPVRQGSESTFTGTNGVGSLAGGGTKFRVVNGSNSTMDVSRGEDKECGVDGNEEKKPSIWGAKIFIGNGKGKESTSASASASGHSNTHSTSASASASTSDHSNSHCNQAGPSATGPSTWSSVVGVVRQGGNLVEAMKSSAERGIGSIGRIRSGGKKEKEKKSGKGWGKKKAKVSEDGVYGRGRESGSEDESDEGSEAEGHAEGEGSDEEFASLPSPETAGIAGGVGGTAVDGTTGTPVWQIYSRPRAATDASNPNLGASASQYSLGSTSNLHSSGGQPSGPTLTRNASNARSVRSAASHGSLRSRLGLGRTQNQANVSTGSISSLGRGHKQNGNGSVTSLESIPEVRSPPADAVGRSGSLGRSGSGKRAGGRKGDGTPPPPPPSSYMWSEPAGASSSAFGGTASTSNAEPATIAAAPPKKAHALPPRLSLHQSRDSSDLASWSEALLSGISLGGDSGLDLALGLGDKESELWEREKERELRERERDLRERERELKEKERELMELRELELRDSETATLDGGMTARPKPPPPATARSATPPLQPRSRKSGHPLPTSKPPPQRPIPPIVIANPNGVPSRAVPRLGTGGDSPAPISGVPETARPPMSAGVNKPLPPIRPPPVPTPAQSTNPSRGADGLLSPPVPNSAWSTQAQGDMATAVLSPAGSSNGPDSAQLWNEIEQMMDPGMMSAVPGLHLSVALPPGAQGVLRSARLGPATPIPPPLNLSAAAALAGPRNVPGTAATQLTVGDLVGSSPIQAVTTYPYMYSAALTGGFSPTIPPFTPEEDRMHMIGERTMSAVLDLEDDGSYYGDEDTGYEGMYGYDGIDVVNAPQPPPQLASELHQQLQRERDMDATLLTVSRPNSHLDVEDTLLDRDPNRDSSRSSSSTLTVTALAATTIVRHASIARRTGAYVVRSGASPSSSSSPAAEGRHPPSPLSSHFGGSEESSGGSGSMSSSSQDQDVDPEHPTPTTDGGIASPLLYYLDGTQTPSPTPDKVAFSGVESGRMKMRRLPGPGDEVLEFVEEDEEEEFEGYPDEETMEAQVAAAAAASTAAPPAPRPTIVISDEPLESLGSGAVTSMTTANLSASPLSPFQRYRGWLSDVVAPLEEFIDDAVDPRDHYLDLTEIAEGESGSVFAALLNPVTAHKLRLPPLIKAQDTDDVINNRVVMVAIKAVAIVPSGSPKLVDLQRELTLMRGLGLGHENVLGMDGVYVDLQQDELWVRMELMERSLADIVGLVGDGLQLQERTIARFTSDVLCALDYLQKHNIAHRDVRSDNLLLNKHGVLKLADFSNAVQVTKDNSMRDDIVGVAFWQAPEVRKPPYDALKVDVWSLGATVWEMAQQDPPFADTQQLAERWPPLRQPELYSPAFHDFLRRCSEPAGVRPSPGELLKSSFIVHKACGRHVVVLLLSQCMAIEKQLQEGSPAS